MRPVRIILPLLLAAFTLWACFQLAADRRLASEAVVPEAAQDPLSDSLPVDSVPTWLVSTTLVREHPLTPALRLAREAQEQIRKNIQDYKATLLKRERIGSKLGDRQTIRVKIRHRPFSIYVGLLDASGAMGDEAIYIEGQNDGKLWGHTTGITGKLLGTVSLRPDSLIAMQGQRYPMTEIGILNLCQRLIQVGEEDLAREECEVKFLKGQKLEDRECTCIEVTHPVRRSYFRFHRARIFVDDQRNVPLRYEAYDWPAEPRGEPLLLEQYEYRDLQFNCGLTDADFSPKNPAYQFP